MGETKASMRRKSMSIIKAVAILESEAGGRCILSPPAAPAIKGSGSSDIICGVCGTVLIEGVQTGLALRNIVIRCPICRQLNDME